MKTLYKLNGSTYGTTSEHNHNNVISKYCEIKRVTFTYTKKNRQKENNPTFHFGPGRNVSRLRDKSVEQDLCCFSLGSLCTLRDSKDR